MVRLIQWTIPSTIGLGIGLGFRDILHLSQHASTVSIFTHGTENNLDYYLDHLLWVLTCRSLGVVVKGLNHLNLNIPFVASCCADLYNLDQNLLFVASCYAGSRSFRTWPAVRCELCRTCIVHIQPEKHVLDHAACTAPTRQHGLDHTDQEHICPNISRSWAGDRWFWRCANWL